MTLEGALRNQDGRTAMASTSRRAPRGNAAAWMQERAGNGADVGEGALGLRGRAVWDFARGGIDGQLPRYEDERAGVDSLRVGTDCSGGGGGGEGLHE